MNMESKEIVLSPLGHTWILDIDGTIVKHNGYKIDGNDTLLPGVKEFLNQIPQDDMVIFLTSRTDEYKDLTISFLEENNIRYNHIIFNATSFYTFRKFRNTRRDIFDLGYIIDESI